jgi:hypothetical protein
LPFDQRERATEAGEHHERPDRRRRERDERQAGEGQQRTGQDLRDEHGGRRRVAGVPRHGWHSPLPEARPHRGHAMGCDA